MSFAAQGVDWVELGGIAGWQNAGSEANQHGD
jgi:hypothetical protein